MLRTHSLLITAALITTAAPGGYCCCPDQAALVKHSSQYRTKYVNIDYRFSVDLPHGMVGFGSVTPAPNHGFVAFHPGSSQFCLRVDVFYVNPDDSLKHHQFISEHKAPAGRTTLDHLETADSVTKVEESCGGRQTSRTLETVVAIASEGVVNGFPVEEMEYRVVLDAADADYAAGQAMLKQVVESFRRLHKATAPKRR